MVFIAPLSPNIWHRRCYKNGCCPLAEVVGVHVSRAPCWLCLLAPAPRSLSNQNLRGQMGVEMRSCEWSCIPVAYGRPPTLCREVVLLQLFEEVIECHAHRRVTVGSVEPLLSSKSDQHSIWMRVLALHTHLTRLSPQLQDQNRPCFTL